MKYLYNRKEILRYINIVMFLFFLVYIVSLSANTSLNYVINKALIGVLLVLVICEVVVLCIWYPDEVKRKKALVKGEVFEGTISDVRHKRTKYLITRNLYIYTIIVEFGKNGENTIVEFGEYSNNPSDYIPYDRKCKVYAYKGKYYIEKFKLHKREQSIKVDNEYHTLSEKEKRSLIKNIKYPIEEIEKMSVNEAFNATSERIQLAGTISKERLYFLPYFFRTFKPYSLLFLEVRIESKKAYGGFDFDISEEVQKFMNIRIICDDYSKVQFVYDMKEMIKAIIDRQNKKIKVKDIIIVIK